MASAFRPLNTTHMAGEHRDDEMDTSPGTPTPTRATFNQRPLPSSPFPQAVQIPESIEENKELHHSDSSQHQKSRGDSEDADMDEDGQGSDGSDDESINADGTRSGKKKKSQRFYCTDYPPCHLSFTRSEHLARHIRKHTGERPFQCHCSRRFSRLDNLRQHAQTVHVNEDIPIDSLAATGTRFQRQIRTDRVRQPGRARASTAGSIGGPGRGHTKSLSTSNIGPIGSAFSAREDIRRRPPPLVMADPRTSRLSFEPHPAPPPDAAYGYRPVSPSEFSTPTSATFSTDQSSPRWTSTMASPTSSHSRAHSMYTPGSRTPGRRLSVPSSGGIPFHSPHGTSLGRPLFGPGPHNSSHAVLFSPTSSVMASPTASAFSRRDSMSSVNADEAWRRRTWHPDSNNFQNSNITNPASRLSNVMTPSQAQSPVTGPPPIATPAGAAQNYGVRLPGIESFDPIPHRPVSPRRSEHSPMMVDSTPHPATLLPPADNLADERRDTVSWDMGLHRGLTRLDITQNRHTPPRDGASSWARDTNHAVNAEADRARTYLPSVRPGEPAVVINGPPVMTGGPGRGYHQHTMSAPSFASTREKRRGWYNGPVTGHSEEPAGKIARVERMVHPNVHAFSGFPAREAPPPPTTIPEDAAERDNMLRLQALVAVATGEGNATAAY
ncbi:C2H2 transcription facotor [Microdochium nivale]|nr:C2H2 transcription facotor [Microdochium nivale]